MHLLLGAPPLSELLITRVWYISGRLRLRHRGGRGGLAAVRNGLRGRDYILSFCLGTRLKTRTSQKTRSVLRTTGGSLVEVCNQDCSENFVVGDMLIKGHFYSGTVQVIQWLEPLAPFIAHKEVKDLPALIKCLVYLQRKVSV